MVELFYNKEERKQLLDIFSNSEYSFPTKAALKPRSDSSLLCILCSQWALQKSIASPNTTLPLRVQ